MGLFSRKNPDPLDGQKGRARVPVSSEAQAAQWRARARRRLVGAVALVLAAVIVLPMALDSEPEPVSSDVPIVIPDRNMPYTPQISAQTPGLVDPGVTQSTSSSTPVSPAVGTNSAANAASTAITPQRPASPPSEPARTDDGSRALALLEGRTQVDAPRPSASAASNAYVLQLAAYSSRPDAETRRDKLRAAGLGNVFVEEAIVNGKPQYRLRVGPFSTREAAQAAQSRLHTLGYDNGFIAAQ